MPKPKSSDTKHPKSGDLHIDASDITVVDLTPEQIPGLSKLRKGAGRQVASPCENEESSRIPARL